MGTVASRMSRPLKNWNIENRAHKIISKDKPSVAPTFESVKKQIDIVDQLDPEYKTVSNRKDTQLNDHLKRVYVSSNSAEIEEIDSRSNPDRPLPREKVAQERFEFGFYETKTVKEGRISLRQAIDLISKHSKEPEKYTPEFIATEYKIEPLLAANILDYYKVFEVYDIKGNFTRDVVTALPISQRSGVTIKHTMKIKKRRKELPPDETIPPQKQMEEK